MTDNEWAVDLDFVPFRQKMDTFLQAMDAYTTSMKEKLAHTAQAHQNEIKERNLQKGDVERAIAGEKEKEKKMLQTLEQERATLADLNSSLSNLNISLDRLRERNQSLDSETNKVKQEVNITQAEKDRQKKVLEAHRAQDQPELDRLQELLGWRVEGTKNDQLFMRFTQIDPSDAEKEYSLVIDIAQGKDITVPKCHPVIPNLANLVADLNKDQDVYRFVKRARQAFRQTVTNTELTHNMFASIGGKDGSRPGSAAGGRGGGD